MKEKLEKITNALLGVGVLATIAMTIGLNVSLDRVRAKRLDSKDYATKIAAVYIPGVVGENHIFDVDKDGTADVIINRDPLGSNRQLLYFAPEHRGAYDTLFRPRYSKEMTPKIREQATRAMNGVNGLGYEIAQHGYEARQKGLEEKAEANKIQN